MTSDPSNRVHDYAEWRLFAESAEARLGALLRAQYEGRTLLSLHKDGPDILVRREPDTPVLAVDLKVWQWRIQNLNNRVQEVLANAVQHRRKFTSPVHLGLVVQFVPWPLGPHPDPSQLVSQLVEHGVSLISRLVRQDSDDAGFERVVLMLGDSIPTWAEINRHGTLLPLADITAAASRLQTARSDIVYRRVPDPPDPLRPARILLVADEWYSHTGGISTFNREFARAFSAAGCDVQVVIPDAQGRERDDALAEGVTLITPVPIPGVVGLALLLTRPQLADSDWTPDLIVGHGRILGPYAYALQNQFFPRAKRLHVVHTDAEQLEMVKEQPEGRSAVLIADERRELEAEMALSADLVAGVGPLLTERIKDEMRGDGRDEPPVIEILPGLRDWGATVSDPPARRQVLLIARAEDVRSKGIDLAAKAVAYAVDKFDGDIGDKPTLVVRGVPETQADTIREQLNRIVAPDFLVVPRVYSANIASLKRDLWQSRVLVMPSRHEGFGLVALEAIAAGVPVLVSRESGVGRMLLNVAMDAGRPNPRGVLATGGLEEDVVASWGEAIYELLVDPAAAFARATELREQIKGEMSWPKAVAAVVDHLGLPTVRGRA